MAALTELIDFAPWREAVTCRETWPHEYVLTEKEDQRELLAAVCDRFRAKEGVVIHFFGMENTYLFIGDYNNWLMIDYNDIDPPIDINSGYTQERLLADVRSARKGKSWCGSGLVAK